MHILSIKAHNSATKMEEKKTHNVSSKKLLAIKQTKIALKPPTPIHIDANCIYDGM